MAVKGGLSNKRFGYVGVKRNSRSNKSESSTSDYEEESISGETEVRDEFSIRKLMQKGERFNSGEENIDNSVGDEGSACPATSRKRKNSETVSQAAHKCLNKNALSAKMNRERKKKYILSLETENKNYKKENDELIKTVEMRNKLILHLKHEISYLKSVLANSKELCQIIQSIKFTGLPVTSSLDSFKRVFDSQNKENSANFQEAETFHEPILDQPLETFNNLPISGEDVNLGSLMNLSDLQLPNLESPFYNIDSLANESNFINENPTDIKLDERNLNFDQPDGVSGSEGGICLHLNKKMISLEFCYFCNKNYALSVLPPPN